MNIQSTEYTHTWSKFMTLTHAARVRNAGFDLPLAPAKTGVTGRQGALHRQTPAALPPRSLYRTPAACVGKKHVLGNRFDAYA